MTNELTDTLAQIVYPTTFVVCMTWVGIAIAHATNSGRLCYAMLALAMLFSALAFGMLGWNAGREVIYLHDVLLYFRVLMTMATVFGSLFTFLYLWRIWRKGKGKASKDADYQGMD